MTVESSSNSGVKVQRGPRLWLLVSFLTIVYTYAFIDRKILALLVQPIKRTLELSDTQISLLLGLSFALFYSLLNLPAGYLVDRFRRFLIIGVATAIWSAMTIVCGLSNSFWQLAAGRAGVGLAEAVVTPASFSLLRDAVSPSWRGRAFGIFAMGPELGNALSLLIGGALIQAARRGAFAETPWLSQLQDWQVVLVVLGLAGFPLAVLVLCFREPPRSITAGPGLRESFKSAIQHIRTHAAVYTPLLAYVSAGAVLSFGAGAWLPAMLERKWGVPTSQIGFQLGVITLLFAAGGLLVTGVVLDRLVRAQRDIRSFGVVGAVLALFAYALAPLAPSLTLTWTCIAIGFVFKGAWAAVGAATLAEITPSHLMGRITAIYFLMQNLIGQALGPTMVAVVADTAFEGRSAIASALSSVSLIVTVIAIACVWRLRAALRVAGSPIDC